MPFRRCIPPCLRCVVVVAAVVVVVGSIRHYSIRLRTRNPADLFAPLVANCCLISSLCDAGQLSCRDLHYWCLHNPHFLTVKFK